MTGSQPREGISRELPAFPGAPYSHGPSDESTEGTFSPKNGTVSATLVITAPECPSSAPPTCGNGQTLELSAIVYTNISLTDTTHSISAGGLPDSVGPGTFFTCP